MNRRRSSILGLSHSTGKAPLAGGRARPFGALQRGTGTREDSWGERWLGDGKADGSMSSETLQGAGAAGSSDAPASEEEVQAGPKIRVTFGVLHGANAGGRAAASAEAESEGGRAQRRMSRVSRASRVSLGTLSSNDVVRDASGRERGEGKGAGAGSRSKPDLARSKSVLSVYQGFSDMMLG